MAPKRKRAGTLTSSSNTNNEAESAAAPVTQPSSGDASGEDASDAVLENVKEQKSQDPPAKRTRSSTINSSRKEDGGAGVNGNGSGNAIAATASTIQEDGENGEAGSMRMEAPPKAGTLDPVGYHTNAAPEGRPVRVYADGVFDLFHLGHMRQLQQAKTAFPDTHLIVGVTGDSETHKRKGLTVLSGKERAESVRHCRWVDEVIEDCPWVITVDFLQKHKIDYVAHDDIPYGANEGDDIYKPIKERGMFLVTQRTEGVSTTGIITKIVRDYEQYIARQLKRGTTRRELNISWFKKNELDIKRHVAELRDNIRQNWTSTGQELGRELKQFWGPSRQNSPAPTPRGGSGTPRNGTPGGVSSSSNNAKSPPPLLRVGSHADRMSTISGISTPGRSERGGKNLDFAAGYAMGLIGGVKGWMQNSVRRSLSDSRPQSPLPSDGDEDSGEHDMMEQDTETSPPVEDEEEESKGRGRRGRSSRQAEAAEAANSQLKAEMSS